MRIKSVQILGRAPAIAGNIASGPVTVNTSGVVSITVHDGSVFVLTNRRELVRIPLDACVLTYDSDSLADVDAAPISADPPGNSEPPTTAAKPRGKPPKVTPGVDRRRTADT